MRKIYSIIVVIFTICYVVLMLNLNSNKYNNEDKNKALQVFQKIKNINISSVFHNKDMDNRATENVSKKIEPPVIKYKPEKPLPKAIIKAKLDRAYMKEKEVMDSLKDNTGVDEKNKNIGNTILNQDKKTNNKQNVPTINTSETEKSKDRKVLTISDRDKILQFAKVLSPIDQANIKSYLENIKEADIKSALDLLKNRLTDKEYEKVKELEEKYNN